MLKEYVERISMNMVIFALSLVFFCLCQVSGAIGCGELSTNHAISETYTDTTIPQSTATIYCSYSNAKILRRTYSNGILSKWKNIGTTNDQGSISVNNLSPGIWYKFYCEKKSGSCTYYGYSRWFMAYSGRNEQVYISMMKKC